MVRLRRAIRVKIQKLIAQAEKIHDPRRQYGYLQHKLVTIVIIAFCAIICGAEDCADIEEFGNIRKEWLAKFLRLDNGIPDKDTFRRVFERLNPSEVAQCLYGWLEKQELSGKTVNIDGKLFAAVAVQPSIDLGLVPQTVSASGNGTCVKTGASPYGVKTCDCKAFSCV